MVKYILAGLLCIVVFTAQIIPHRRHGGGTISYTTVMDTVKVNAEDAYSVSTSVELLSDGSGIVWIGYEFGEYYQTGFIFQLSVPKNATVDTAQLTLYISNTENLGVDDSVDIYVSNEPSSCTWPDWVSEEAHSLTAHDDCALIVRKQFNTTANSYITVDGFQSGITNAVACASWSSGNQIAVILDHYQTGGGDKYAAVVDYSGGGGVEYYARIRVVYH